MGHFPKFFKNLKNGFGVVFDDIIVGEGSKEFKKKDGSVNLVDNLFDIGNIELIFLDKNRLTVSGIYFCIFVLQLRGDHGLGGRGVCRQVALLLAQKCRQYRLSMWRPNEQ